MFSLQESTDVANDMLSRIVQRKVHQTVTISVQHDHSHVCSKPIAFWDPTLLLGAFPYLFLSTDGLPTAERPPGEDLPKITNVYPSRCTPISFRDQVVHLLKLSYTDH